jgi:hypothetical protein
LTTNSSPDKAVQERMQEVKTALTASDPKGVVVVDLGTDKLTLGAITALLRLGQIHKKNGGLYLTPAGRTNPLLSFAR